ncbi:MAG: MucB/RseB C-terminal domain-containing protein [Gammaproteobacteria bacterium]
MIDIYSWLRFVCLLTGLALFNAASLAAEDISPAFLIKRMVAAASALNYQGVFVYQRGNQLDSMRILHRLNGDTEIERLISLSGPAREVIRRGDEVKCLFPDDKEVMVEKIQPKDFFTFGLNTSVAEISKHYRLKISGTPRIAGREAIAISIVPEDSDRYAYQLAVDSESGLLLQSAVYDRKSRVLEQVQFAEIHIGGDIPMSDFEPQVSGEGYTWHTSGASQNQQKTIRSGNRWVARWLPSGFRMRNEMTQRFADVESPVSHLVYTDGVAMVSIFVEEQAQRPAPDEKDFSTLGAVNAMSVKLDQNLITVVGELPLPTLQRIAASVNQID